MVVLVANRTRGMFYESNQLPNQTEYSGGFDSDKTEEARDQRDANAEIENCLKAMMMHRGGSFLGESCSIATLHVNVIPANGNTGLLCNRWSSHLATDSRSKIAPEFSV